MIPLRAGPVALAFSDGDLRDIRVGTHEVVRRVYMVFQDLNWTARPWRVDDVDAHIGTDAFDITFTGRGTFDAERFAWTGHLTGQADGRITYSVRGLAEAPFMRNRLGLCVLHPMSAAGAPCMVEHVDGTTGETRFPDSISPHQPFLGVRAITHEFAPGGWATVTMLGETFETEDHRNWSDASFKTYSTPIALPFPVLVPESATLEQSVVIDVGRPDVVPEPSRMEAPVSISIDLGAPAVALPRLGLQVAADGATLGGREASLLRALQLDHLRVDVDLADPAARGRLASAAQQARAIDSRLVVALHVPDIALLPDVAVLAAAHHDVIDCWLLFEPASKVTGPGLIAAARTVLGPEARIGGGTDLYFAELNRTPADPTGIDVVAFSLNPQVHASDDVTVMQNLAAQSVVATQAAELAGGAEVYVSPVTLRPRFNPNATRPDLDVSSTALPSTVDARQATPFTAAWTIGSVARLATTERVSAITYFETTGWRGLVERDEGTPQPADFPSTPGVPFPVYGVFALLAGFTHMGHVRSSEPEQVAAVIVEDGSRRRLLVANLVDRESAITVIGPDRRNEEIRLAPYAHASFDYPKDAS